MRHSCDVLLAERSALVRLRRLFDQLESAVSAQDRDGARWAARSLRHEARRLAHVCGLALGEEVERE